MKLIWLCHPIKKAVGGVKVIYRQAELANQMLQPLGHSAVVMHPNTWRFRVKWFDTDLPVERRWFHWRWVGKPSLSGIDGCFDPQRELVILPELWARKYGDQLARLDVPYAIYVQNGYYISKGEAPTLNAAYGGCTLHSDDFRRRQSLRGHGFSRHRRSPLARPLFDRRSALQPSSA